MAEVSLRILTAALTCSALVATGSRWVDVASSPVVLMQSLSPLAAPTALAGLVAAVLTGRWAGRTALSVVCVLVLAVHAAIWAPWLTAEELRAGRGLTVLSVNLYLGRADPAAIARVVRTRDVDVLVLTEVRPSASAGLRAHGVHHRLPHVVPKTPAVDGTVIRSRLPLGVTPGSSVLDPPVPGQHPVAGLRHGDGPTLRAVHPVPPVRARVRQWRTTLGRLAVWAERTPGPLVVAGDFNASVDHPGMRQLLATGLRDAHEVAGAGRPPTWPQGRSLPAFVHIDHVLVRGVGVDSVEEMRIPGSDHDAVLADLVVPFG